MWGLLKKEFLWARSLMFLPMILLIFISQLPGFGEFGLQGGVPGLMTLSWFFGRTSSERTMDPVVFALPVHTRDLVLVRYLSPFFPLLLSMVVMGIFTLPRFLPGLPDWLALEDHVLPNIAFMACMVISWLFLTMAIIIPVEIAVTGFWPVIGAYLTSTILYVAGASIPFISHESHRQDLFFPVAAVSLVVSAGLLVMSVPLSLYLAKKRRARC